jgi:hypothetical protein
VTKTDISTPQPPIVSTNSFHRSFKINSSLKSFFWRPISTDEVLVHIYNTSNNKSPGADTFSPFLIKKIAPNICKILTYLFNKSLGEGKFPSKLKMAKVIPIPKKGNTIDCNRPISLLSIFSKIFEKLVKVRLISFLNLIDFFVPNQFGFREGLSTELALRKFLLEVHTNLNNKQVSRVSALFLDIRKAFDTINHNVLLEKLELAGIRGLALSWFQSYLSGRSQFVCVNEAKSSIKYIYAGVPQGSVLGPILFLIFINDLYHGPFSGTITAFADDTAFNYGANSLQNLHSQMQSDLNLLALWFSFNKLKLNADKTTYLNFSLSEPFAFEKPLKYHTIDCLYQENCSCSEISQSSKVKYLGLSMEDDLLWRGHIQILKNSLRMLLHRFYHIKNLCPISILKNIYFSLAHSRISYGISCWGCTYITHLKPLIRLQKSLLYFLHEEPVARASLFNNLKILSLRSLFIYKVLLQFYWASGNLGNTIDLPEQGPLTRGAGQVRVPRPNSTFFRKSFLFLEGKFCNKLPLSILNTESPRLFKRSLKMFLLNANEEYIESMYKVIE